MKFIVRKPSKALSWKRRFLRLTSHEQVKIRHLESAMLLAILKLKVGTSESLIKKYKRVGIIAALQILIMTIAPIPCTMRTPSKNRTVESFQEEVCPHYFRIQRKDFRKVISLLKFPEVVRFENRSFLPGEEVFLRGMYELVSGIDQARIAQAVFGRDDPLQSRAFKAFVDHIYDNFEHLVHHNLDWWYRTGYLRQSMEAFRSKMKEILISRYKKEPNDAKFISEIQPVALLIDCNCLPTGMVGGGPAEEGANAARWSDAVQKAFYIGWKSIHGLKHQTVDCAFGLTVDIYGPISLRRNDLHALRNSERSSRFQTATNGEQFTIMGDSAYIPKHTLLLHTLLFPFLKGVKNFNGKHLIDIHLFHSFQKV